MSEKKREIYITKFDQERLKRLVMVASEFTYKGPAYIKDLEQEINRAKVVEPKDIPGTAVTMNSTVRMTDMDTDEEMEYTLVFPDDADVDAGKISIMSPIGTAILGYSVGDVIEWRVPRGTCRIRIDEIVYQPEKSGNFNF